MIVCPVYSLAQVTVMPLLGAIHYVVLARRKRRLGRYGFGYRRRRPVETTPPARLQAAVRLSSR